MGGNYMTDEDWEIHRKVERESKERKTRAEAPYRALSGVYRDEIMAIGFAGKESGVDGRAVWEMARSYVETPDRDVAALKAHFAGAPYHHQAELDVKKDVWRGVTERWFEMAGGLNRYAFQDTPAGETGPYKPHDPAGFAARVTYWKAEIAGPAVRAQKPVSFGL